MNSHISTELLLEAGRTANKYKSQALINGAKIIANLDYEVTSSNQLKDIPFIGDGIRKRVDIILKSNNQSDLSSVIGIGKTKANELTKKGIKTIKDLKKSNVKLTRAQQLGLKYHGLVKGEISRYEMFAIKKVLQGVNPDNIICGSYRRGKSASGDVDVLIWSDNESKHLKRFVKGLFEVGFLLDTINEDFQTSYMGFCKMYKWVRRIDIKCVPPSSLGAALLYFTGPYDLNKYMRSRAKRRGMLLNEYGLWKVNGEKRKLIPTDTERDIFDKLEMKYLTPTERDIFR